MRVREEGKAMPAEIRERRRGPSERKAGFRSGIPLSQQARFVALAGFLLLCAVGGGGARADIYSLLYLRPAAVICMVAILLVPGRVEWRLIRVPLLLMLALAAVMLIQLIPLPPDLWLSLPGHERYGEAAIAAGIPQPWRPLSLTPALTVNSLVSLLIPLAVLIGFAAVHERYRPILMKSFVGIAVASAVLGIAQVIGEPGGPAYLYEITNPGLPVGLFSNRNHEAVFLAAMLPLLAAWTGLVPRDRLRPALAIAAGVGMFLLAMVMVTGSRAGALMALVGILGAFLLLPSARRSQSRYRWAWQLLWLAPLLLVALTWSIGRFTAIDRLVTMHETTELRAANSPLVVDITRDFMPFGSGFGSFDPVFRNFEADRMLSFQYFNHAHNDLLELAMTGGIPALLVLLAFLLWAGRRSFVIFAGHRRDKNRSPLQRAAAFALLILLAASLFDYPLRTPLISAFAALACGWLTLPPLQTERRRSNGLDAEAAD
jgi:hypothetical protein